MIDEVFKSQYEKLNKAQKEAVEKIEGPVMVVAGPGTGKTQILSLRIANILHQTDTGADGILCLTFTNSGVRAMRERLEKYIGAEAGKVNIATFHSFAMSLIEDHHEVLGYERKPKIMDEKTEAIALCDEILRNNEWQHISPRSDSARYFKDLKSLISNLKRERISPAEFADLIGQEIQSIKDNPDNISSRGSTKGELKAQFKTRIDSLGRSLEAMRFYEIYEERKKEKNLLDYDDVMSELSRLVGEVEEVRDTLKENYLYVLVDEHQDSTLAQNEFLEIVWGGEEKPNVFVVGDDRQLIYGFGGAKIEYFEKFKHVFDGAEIIHLVENYRSTQSILDASHELLESTFVKDPLNSNSVKGDPIKLVEANYPRDEILAFGLFAKNLLEKGVAENQIALLVPKNQQVRSASLVLKALGLKTTTSAGLDLFERKEAETMMHVLRLITDPGDNVSIGNLLLDPLSGVEALDAHKFMRKNSMRNFSLIDFVPQTDNSLFGAQDPASVWVGKLKSWVQEFASESIYTTIQRVGQELLIDQAQDHKDLVTRVEVVRTFLHLAMAFAESNPRGKMNEFISFINRLQDYGERIELAAFDQDSGIKIMTLHGSKGLEFEHVWVAHLDKGSFSTRRYGGFALPEVVLERLEERNEEVLKRELYVAMTRAKTECVLSYALNSYTGRDTELAGVVKNIENLVSKKEAQDTEKELLDHDPNVYTTNNASLEESVGLKELADLVAQEYPSKKVSVSALNNFMTCPWRWYFRNMLELPEPKADSLDFGNLIHMCIDEFVGFDKKPTQKQIDEILETKISKLDLEKDKEDKFRKEAVVLLGRWVDERLPEIARVRKPEQSVALKYKDFPHLNIYGRLDLIEVLDDKSLRVTDFKTGKPRKKSEIEKVDHKGKMSDYMRQLAMYSLLLENSPKWKAKVSESVLEFVEAKEGEQGFYRGHIGPEEVDMLLRDIGEYDSSLKDGTWVCRPCEYKPFGRGSAECPYCKKALIYSK